MVPLLAFDKDRNRLGYGGGYYDRTIAALRGKKARFWPSASVLLRRKSTMSRSGRMMSDSTKS